VRLVAALVIVLVGFWIARRVAGLVRRGIERRADDPTLGVFLENLAYFALVVVFIVGALDLAGVPTTSLLAAMGAAGLALGLALKDSLSNVAAGVLLIVTRPFRVGDIVEVAGRAGTVLEIKLMQTRLLTPDNSEVTMPNGIVMTAPVVNFTARPERRLELTLPLGPDADAGRALEVAREALQARPEVVPGKPVDVVLTRVGPQGFELAARPWIRTADYHAAQSALLAELRAALAREHIATAHVAHVLRLARE
jgi:small conductance mechanosensitive channel